MLPWRRRSWLLDASLETGSTAYAMVLPENGASLFFFAGAIGLSLLSTVCDESLPPCCFQCSMMAMTHAGMDGPSRFVHGARYVKFDTFTPAADSGLPVTRVISRMTLQEILVKAVGTDIVRNGVTVLNYKDDGSKVRPAQGTEICVATM